MYKYYLPTETEELFEGSTENNAIIIIGANGAGKSQLGAWLEKKDLLNIHRIGAQRSLSFGNFIQQKSYEQATNLLLGGNDNSQGNHDGRWGWDGEKINYTSSLLNDYEHVLSAIVALKTNQQEEYIQKCKELEASGKVHEKVPDMVIDTLQKIWKSVFPHREVDIIDGKVIASFSKSGNKVQYKGRDMSDGERVALYLIAQLLCVPKNKTIIIDEPEIHLHRSIMNKLWEAIEKERQDCLFIYITHDTQFAANHRQAKKIWVKSFDGARWDWQEVETSVLPEQLLLDILGNRKSVLFVEGTIDSYDTKLYTEIFKEYYIVPCGSCSSVIAWAKAMNNTTQLHDLKCYGIIDRDYRTDFEIAKYKSDNIYTLKVAEVENLFLVPEVLEKINSIMGFQDKSRVECVKNYIIETRFGKELKRQICESVVAELKYRLTTASISKNNEDEAKVTLDSLIETISYETVKKEHEVKFQEAYDSKDFARILEVFNRKSLSTSTGHFFDLDNKAYCDFVVRQLYTDKAEEIKNAIALYVPDEIPR